MRSVLLFFLVLIFAQSFSIKHVVVLMMENRSFDHLLGFLKKIDPRVDGLTGAEFNLYNVSDPTSPKQFVNQKGFDTGPDDPGHSWEDTAEQIYGYVVKGDEKPTPKMSGFVQNALEKNNTPYNALSMFNYTTAPIINTLAHEFVVFDKWFAGLPGPTDPNRAFAMSGTTDGVITNFNGTLWGQQSYFDFLTKNSISWKAYYQDDPWAVMYFQDVQTGFNKAQITPFPNFFQHLENGELSQFTWLQPRSGTHDDGPPTWQHPTASVSEGERLIKTVYEALRKSKHWEDLAFIITYDEHGGFYDHVAPPQEGVPNPDGVKNENGFNFDRLGIRLPTVLISPKVARNQVVHEPKGPTSTSQYTSTSIIATCNKIFGIDKNLAAGKRIAWSGTFEHLFQDEARNDCPMNLPEIPPWTQEDLEKQMALPLVEQLEQQIRFYCTMNERGPECGKDITNQHEASLFIRDEAKIFMAKE